MLGEGKLYGIKDVDAWFTVNSVATIYRDKTNIFVPFAPYKKLKPGLELDKTHSELVVGTLREQSMNKEENIERSTRRARKDVSDLIKFNEFHWFGTITADPNVINRYDPEVVKTALHNWLKAERRKYRDFGYVVIPELHKDGAIHFHTLFKDYPDFVPAHNEKYQGQMQRKGRLIYNLAHPPFGHTDFERIENKEAVSHYVLKYVTKDMPTFADKKRYWSSRNLKKPTKLDDPSWFDVKTPPPGAKMHLNEWGVTMTYDNAQLPLNS